MSDACTYGSYHTLHSLSRIQSYPAHTPTDMSSSGGGGGSSSTANNHNNNTSAASSSGGKGNKNQKNKMTSSSPRRLVKGVQIYLRERSTGT